MALDVITIPASSCDCERMFSELGDLLEPKRRAIGAELLAAIQLVRSWTRVGYGVLDNVIGDGRTNEDLVREYNIDEWDCS